MKRGIELIDGDDGIDGKREEGRRRGDEGELGNLVYKEAALCCRLE